MRRPQAGAAPHPRFRIAASLPGSPLGVLQAASLREINKAPAGKRTLYPLTDGSAAASHAGARVPTPLPEPRR